MAFCSIHNHTYSSNIRFLDCINRPEEMINKAISLGFSGIAFTDHESLSAAVTILKIRDKIKDDHPDFKIIFGNEIYLIDESEIKNTNKYYHFILLAKDEIGWQQLKTLSSRAWERGYTEKGIMRVPTTYQDIEEVVGKNPGHLICSTACLGGYLDNAILEKDNKKVNWFIPWLIQYFGKENVQLEMQSADSEEQITCNKFIIRLAQYFDLPYIVTTDSHYLDKDDFSIHSAFLNSKQSNDRETEKFYKYTYIQEESEMKKILARGGLTEQEINTAIANTQKVADMVEEYDFRHSTIVPSLTLPSFEVQHLLKDWYEKYPLIKHYAYSKYDQDRYLLLQIENGILEKHITIDDEKAERINTELDILLFISKKLGQDVSAYLNLAVDMINIAWKTSLVGCGRGSACGFYINYLIGITQADPLVYGLPYWRFLNKERAEMPDIDSDYQPEKTEDIIALFREAYGDDNVMNCATFKTESLKSAILTCMRGLGYNNDEAQALAASVPSHRGKTYTLADCLYGNEEQGFDPVPGFENKLKSYNGLFEAVQKIEGLPTNASIHASALYIFNNGYLEHNSLMRAPNKTPMTAFNMHDSDDQGALKMDVLRTDAQSKMAKCLDLLLKAGQIEWQGSLRATYDKYLHPDVLEYDNPKMWDDAAEGRISNLFQFETQVGSVCIKKARPTNVMQLAEINSIMRLQVEGDEQPIDRYVRFRNDINLWYKEMKDAGLNFFEIQVLDKYLKKSFGISGSQETLMLLVMDPEITGFTLGEANKFRKAIAKKIAADIQVNKEKYFEYGEKIGTRQCFLDYVWKYCVEPQLGYSFSLNHTLPYSLIAVQEMNLATRWNPLFWACACLCINAGNSATDFDEIDEDEELDVEDANMAENAENEAGNEEEDVKVKRVAPNYGKIAKAISDAQHAGVHIELPDINTAEADFVPDIENNAILYSLQAINVVNPELMDRIIVGRPYKSLFDFLDRVEATPAQIRGLIKAGCFDKLEGKARPTIMAMYLQRLADQEIKMKDKLNMVQVKQALKLGMQLTGYEKEIRLFKFKQYIDKNQKDTANRRYLLTEEVCIRFFQDFVAPSLNVTKGEYSYCANGDIAVKPGAFTKFYEAEMAKLLGYLNSDEGKKIFHRIQQDAFIEEIKQQYCTETVNSWEMETMCFYHDRHELKGMNTVEYNVKNFDTLPEEPKPISVTEKNGKTYENYALCAMAGTVIKTDNTRHIVSLLTLDGVVDVKMYAGIYNQYNQKISVLDKETKKKTVVDDSWFKRGNKILTYGLRRDNMFVVKTDRSSGFNRTVCLINKVRPDGSLDLQFTRKKVR